MDKKAPKPVEARTAVLIPCGGARLRGELIVPANALGAVVFAHGSGSSRHSPRNRYVAGVLRAGGLATLLLDLLSVDEDLNPELRFDMELLAMRLSAARNWLLSGSPRFGGLGFFGASTGAGAALLAASKIGGEIAAVVSRGGRPDLAGDEALTRLASPTLLIVGAADQHVLTLNQRAFDQIRCEKSLQAIPGASHLFEEQGTLERAAHLARDWFVMHMPPAAETPAAL